MAISCILISILSLSFVFSKDFSSDISLEALWGSRQFVPNGVVGNVPMNSDEHFSVLENGFVINEYAYKTGKKTRTIADFHEVFEHAGITPKRVNSFSFSSDEARLLIATEETSIYRRSKEAYYYIFNLSSQELTALSTAGKQQLATFSPDGNMVAYVFENNIYIKNLLTKQTKQVTKDGEKNKIINGTTDWVYEEEFAITQGFYWSPCGQNIAFFKFDESHVKEFVMLIYGELYPEEYRFKYPKAGEKNAFVSIHVYNLPSQQTLEVDVGENTNQYIPRIKWTQDPKTLAVYRLNRLQNHLEILFADALTGVSHTVYEEKNPYHIHIDDHLTFTGDGKYFFLTSQRDGYNHLYAYNMKGELQQQITHGSWDVMDVVAYDDVTQTIYYLSTEDSPLTRHLYAVHLSGAPKKKLSSKDGDYSPTFSKRAKYYNNRYSNAHTPPVYTVNKSVDGRKLRTIEDNKGLQKNIDALNISDKTFFDITTADGTVLNSWMIKPPHFDASKKYPVLFYVYGGPGVQTVRDRWGGHNYLWFQKLAQLGYIIVSVDNRGTPGRGEAFEKVTYKQLGKYETADQIEAAGIISQLPYVDASRIGVYGWSYGGYMALLCMTFGAEYFKTGIAVAPVTHWRYYDTIYTERFMGLPKDNAEGYESYAPINHVDKLKGRLLIVHGSVDDNVHYQNSMDLFYELVNANKDFDMYIYTNKNHSISGGNARLHLFKKMRNYLLENL